MRLRTLCFFTLTLTLFFLVPLSWGDSTLLPMSSAHAGLPAAGPALDWPVIIASILGALLATSEIQALLPTKSNGIIHFLVLVFRNLKGLPMAASGLFFLCAMSLSGCTYSLQQMCGDDGKGNRQAAETPKTVTPTTDVSIPASVIP